MIIHANTKIGSLLKENPKALEAIIGISPKFEKLKNPVLRKLIASRTSIAMAAKVGGCELYDFFKVLEPLGFVGSDLPVEINTIINQPDFNPDDITPGNITILDVRPVISSGNDPLTVIMNEVYRLNKGQALKIINSFEPTPLIVLLEKKGFTSYVKKLSSDHIETIFYRISDVTQIKPASISGNSDDSFETSLLHFRNRTDRIDVRHLQMPQPMMQILEALKNLLEGNALYVTHKRIPLYLLPELAEMHFRYRIKEISANEVHLLIYKQENDQ